MTIAFGILASDGIIVAADSEETHGYTKVDARKIDLGFHWAQDGMRTVLLAGAGDGHSIDTFSQYLRSGVLKDARLKSGDPMVVLDEALERFYEKRVLPFRHYGDRRPDFDLVLAYSGDDARNRLYVSHLNAFLECERSRYDGRLATSNFPTVRADVAGRHREPFTCPLLAAMVECAARFGPQTFLASRQGFEARRLLRRQPRNGNKETPCPYYRVSHSE